MNYLWFSIGIICIVFLLYLRNSYYLGTKKSFQNFLSLIVPIILSSTAIRVGKFILRDSIMISYYIACVGTLLFYLVLSPIIKKETTDRYRKISKESRIFAVFIGMLTLWIFSSFMLFLISLFFPNFLDQIEKLNSIIKIPIYILWFFPQ